MFFCSSDSESFFVIGIVVGVGVGGGDIDSSGDGGVVTTDAATLDYTALVDYSDNVFMTIFDAGAGAIVVALHFTAVVLKVTV